MVGEERGITGPFLGGIAKLGSLSGQSHKNQLSSPSKFVDFDSISLQPYPVFCSRVNSSLLLLDLSPCVEHSIRFQPRLTHSPTAPLHLLSP
jgi:hypothetical protein